MHGYSVTPVDFATKQFNPNNTEKIDLQLLMELLELQGPSNQEVHVQRYIMNWIAINVPSATVVVDNSGNILVTKKTTSKEDVIFPCAVAHMDEVNSFQTDRKIIELYNVLIGINRRTGLPAGCPGDDRVGCYMCLEMLRKLDDVKVAFFIAEEVGCVGSNAVDVSFFSDCGFILQADRKEAVDFIKYTNGIDVSDKAFQDAVEAHITTYGLKFASGTSTDVGTLVKRKVGCCCANIGSGYYDPHTKAEKVCISDVENIMNLMYRLFTDAVMMEKRWEYTAPVRQSTSYYGSDDYGYNWGYRGYGGYHNSGAKQTGGKAVSRSSKKNGAKSRMPVHNCNSCTDINCLHCSLAADDFFYD